jgi:aspartate 1-decarboxylase
MFVKLLKSKLHRATVTDTKLHYAGSIAVDPELMEAVGLLPYEAVVIADLNNGSRLETYVIPSKDPGSGDVIIMGAAAKLIEPKDIVIIFSFAFFTEEEAKSCKPSVVALGENNKIVKRIS